MQVTGYKLRVASLNQIQDTNMQDKIIQLVKNIGFGCL